MYLPRILKKFTLEFSLSVQPFVWAFVVLLGLLILSTWLMGCLKPSAPAVAAGVSESTFVAPENLLKKCEGKQTCRSRQVHCICRNPEGCRDPDNGGKWWYQEDKVVAQPYVKKWCGAGWSCTDDNCNADACDKLY
jgi:hypothetical protein